MGTLRIERSTTIRGEDWYIRVLATVLYKVFNSGGHGFWIAAGDVDGQHLSMWLHPAMTFEMTIESGIEPLDDAGHDVVEKIIELINATGGFPVHTGGRADVTRGD
jgi:hypothetical protein